MGIIAHKCIYMSIFRITPGKWVRFSFFFSFLFLMIMWKGKSINIQVIAFSEASKYAWYS